MCSLFGIIDYQGVLANRQKNRILAVLSRECEVRGTDATGIAYIFGDQIRVHKRPLPAHKMRFHVPPGVRVVMGHTRMTTQGSAKHNYNNHPWATCDFALAHNGVLLNDHFLRETEPLPDTPIETDSYVAVQLLEKQQALNFQSIRTMAEKVQGSFAFTVLDRQDNVYFVRGENPLVILDYNGFYLYASTAEILRKVELRLKLQHQDSVKVEQGDILKIDRNGMCVWERFRCYSPWSVCPGMRPWYPDSIEEDFPGGEYYLLDAAKALGASTDDVQTLIDYGCGTDEIEELLYEPCLLHDIATEIRYDQTRKGVSLWV